MSMLPTQRELFSAYHKYSLPVHMEDPVPGHKKGPYYVHCLAGHIHTNGCGIIFTYWA
jgi:hypothetical protein